MADFKSHLLVSGAIGVGYGFAAHHYYAVPIPTCLLAGGLCGVAGMLPDIDSDSGRPLHESLAFGAAVVAMMVGQHFRWLGATSETIVLVGATAYLAIRFGLGAFLKRFTTHRGMFHSIPAAVIFGQLAFLLSTGEIGLRVFKAGGIVLGYLSHLVLDELYSVESRRGRIRAKRSLGTGLKMFSTKSLSATLLAYAVLALLSYVVVREPNWMHDFHQGRHERMQDEIVEP